MSGRALLQGKSSTFPMCRPTRTTPLSRRSELGAFRTVLGVPMLREGDADRRSGLDPLGGAAFHGKADRAGDHLRRPGGDRDRERAAVRGDPGQEPAAESASKHKSQFLASMSHELRTPLNAIIGVTEMLLEDARDFRREDELEPLERVLRAARHLLALINDVLDLSKIEAGRMELHLETFPLAPVIEDVAKTDRADGHEERQPDRDRLPVGPRHHARRSDPESGRRFSTSPSNANKFTEKGTVTIAAQPQRLEGRDLITVAVTDTGIGMTRRADGPAVPGVHPGGRVDHPQVRRHRPRARHQPAFVPHDGRRHLRREQAWQGSTFTIRLPAAIASAGRP